MQQTLVKVLEEDDLNVQDLTREHIDEFVQTERTVEAISARVIEPFDAFALAIGTPVLYDANGVRIRVAERTQKRKITPKQAVDLLQTTLIGALENQDHGKQMYGVRKFDETVAMDAGYLNERFSWWRDVVLDESTTRRVEYDGKGVEDIARDNVGRLTLLGENPMYMDVIPVKDSDAGLYVAAREQVKRLNTDVITPFGQRFKTDAPDTPDETTFHRSMFGDVSVQVKVVPRDESDFSEVCDALGNQLAMYAGLGPHQTDDAFTFYNDDLLVPRAYVSVEGMLGDIATARGNTETRFRKERPQVLYEPDPAVVLMGE